jgi:hypothetical protein
VRTLLQIGPALVLALLQSASTQAQVPPNPRAEAFSSLDRCTTLRQQDACALAATNLEALLKINDAPQQSEHQPRCLPALTRVETYLAAYRWGLETTADLERVVAEAKQQCPEP